jgi:hypothetical protein
VIPLFSTLRLIFAAQSRIVPGVNILFIFPDIKSCVKGLDEEEEEEEEDEGTDPTTASPRPPALLALEEEEVVEVC